MNATRTCSIDGCGKSVIARGWCSAHYEQWRSSKPTPSCSVEGCEKSSQRKGYCHMHYRRLRVHGDVHETSVLRREAGFTDHDRFSRKHKVNQETGCWDWCGAKFDNGYGAFAVQGKLRKAHRYSYEYAKGEIPAGLQIDHLCRNRGCVNPDHLQAVTPWVNTMRSLGITALHMRKTHCIHGHEFTPENTYVDPGRGGRTCIECRRRRGREHDAKRRSRRRSRKAH